jgi:hypothetical protein
LTLTDLTVSDFFPEESAVNPAGMGDQGPFQIALRAVQLPGGGDGYFAGVVPEPGTPGLSMLSICALVGWARRTT